MKLVHSYQIFSRIIVIFSFTFSSLCAQAQVPQTISYQALLRDTKDRLISNQEISIQLTVRVVDNTGAVLRDEYAELHQTTTNYNGLFTIEIGSGSSFLGSFDEVDWSDGIHYIMTSIDPAGGDNYNITSEAKLMSVPYALHALTAESLTNPEEESDPIFNNSIAATITASDLYSWNNSNITQSSTLPDGGTDGQLLSTDGSGNYIWIDQPASSGVASGITITSIGSVSATNVQEALEALEATKLGLAGGILAGDIEIPTGNRIILTDVPTNATDAANKSYVDGVVASGTVDASTTVKGKIQLAGDLAGTAEAPTVPALAEKLSLVGGTMSGDLSMGNKDLIAVDTVRSNGYKGTWDGEIIAVNKGGTGTKNLTGYVKANGNLAMNASATIPSTDVTGLITKVNGSLPDATGNVSVILGDVSTGTLTDRPSSPGTNGNIYVVSGDVAADNGRTYISDGTNWNEVTTNQSATDARYLQLAGGTLSGDIVVPAGNTITLTYFPSDGTDATNKIYVDNALALKATIASPSFSGIPTAPTAGDGTSTLQVATTEFVGNSVGAGVADEINDQTTAVAPSQNAVFDGLAGKMSYPSSAGSNGEVLTTDGSNGLSWSTSSSGVPYSGASGVVNLGDYDLTVQGYRIGKGTGGASGNLVFGTATLSGSGTGNTVIGVTAAHSLGTGTNNTIIGNAAGWYIGNASGITAIGQMALHAESGAGNTALGYSAGHQSGTSSAMTYTTLLGYEAKATSGAAITNSVALGKGATVLASNTIQLGNTSVTNVKTSGTITVGAITIPKTDGSSGEVLTTDGSGALFWAASTDDQTAVEVTSTAVGSIIAENVDAAIAELEAEKLALAGGTMSGNVAMGSNDISGAATVAATTFLGDLHGTINTATTAITQVLDDNSTKVATTAYADRASTDDQTADEVISSAVGNIIAEDVDAAIAELEAEKLALAGGTMTGDLLGTNASEGATSATSKISGFAATLNAQTGTSYTLTAADNGKVITLSNSSAITLTVPSLFPGFNCLIIQLGAGQVTLNASSTTISNRNSHTKTAGQHAILTLVAITNDAFISSGDMSSS